MRSNKSSSYIYCTPFLDEIERIREQCDKNRFKEPQPYHSTKIDDFNELLNNNDCVAVTHTTFLNATDETLQAIHENEYTLILDECLDVVVDFNQVQTVEKSPRQSISSSDIKMLIDKEMIFITDNYKVEWRSGEYGDDFKFEEVKRYAELGRLYCVRNRLLLTVFPPEMFKCFKNIYVLTYMFDGNILKNYFDLFHLEYKLLSVDKKDSKYFVTDYSNEQDSKFRQICRKLVTVCDSKQLNRNDRTLSKSWYQLSNKDNRLSVLKRDIQSFYRSYVKTAKASKDEIMWTCPKDYKDRLKGTGYIQSKQISQNDLRKLSEKQKQEVEKRISCFVPCNAKATNIYHARWALAYCCNMFFNPMIRGFFEDCNISLNEEIYALSCLIQWICRSRLRNNKPITIYIPSKRMRELFIDWMKGNK